MSFSFSSGSVLSFFAVVEACFVALHVPCQIPPQMGFDFLNSVPMWSQSVSVFLHHFSLLPRLVCFLFV